MYKCIIFLLLLNIGHITLYKKDILILMKSVNTKCVKKIWLKNCLSYTYNDKQTYIFSNNYYKKKKK